jgi:hypothetical protein
MFFLITTISVFFWFNLLLFSIAHFFITPNNIFKFSLPYISVNKSSANPPILSSPITYSILFKRTPKYNMNN